MQTGFLTYLLQTSGCMAVLYLIYWLLLKRETFFRFNRWYLLGSVVLSAVLPLIELPASPTPLYVIPSIELQAVPVVPSGPAEKSFDWPGLLMELYEVGVFVFAARLLYRIYHLRELARQLPREAIKGFVLFRTGGSLPTFSFFNWLFWDDSQKLTEAEERQIRRHEEAHIRQRHSADVLLMEIFTIFFWFNPFVYLFGRELRAVHEYLADREAVREDTAASYAHLMATRVLQKYPLSLTQPFNQFQIKNRITMLRISQNTRPALWKTALSVSLVALLSLVYACRSSESIVPSAPEDPQLMVTQLLGYLDQYPGISTELHVYQKANAQGSQSSGFKSDNISIKSELPYETKARVSGVDNPADQKKIEELIGKISSRATPEQMSAQDKLLFNRLNVKSINVHKDDDDTALNADKIQMSDGAQSPSVNQIFAVVEKMPEYVGGFPELGNFLSQNMKYPAEAREKNIQGTVFVEFVVLADGIIDMVKVVKGLGHGLDEEALRVVKSMPKWTPGMQSGKTVAVRYVLPVKFAAN